MKNRFFRAAVMTVLAFALILAACTAHNLLSPCFSDGDLVDVAQIRTTHTLGHFRRQGNRLCLTLTFTRKPDDMMLLVNSVISNLRINERIVARNEIIKHAVGIKGTPILPQDYRPTSEGYQITFSIAEDEKLAGASMYLFSWEQFDAIVLFSRSMVSIVTGIFMIMSLYGCSLYLFKPSDKYLMLFALYTGALSLWFLPSIIQLKMGFFSSLCQNAYNCAILLSILMCAQMSGFGQETPLKNLYRWYVALPVCVMASWLISWLPLSQQGMEVLRFALYLIQTGILLDGIAKGRPSLWVLMIGLLFSQAVRLVVIQPYYGLVHVSMAWFLIKYLRLGIFVFALCCMLFTNHLLAQKYQEAETLAKELDLKVQQRTAELVRQQQERRNLVANISHDLRTPLFIMKGCLKRLRVNDEDAGTLGIAMKRLEFITRLVDDLFTASKLDDNRLLMETEPFELSAVLQDLVRGLSIEATEKSVNVSCSIEPAVMVWGDEHRIASALQNVAVNALAYTPRDGRICITLRTEEKHAVVSISDNGPGIRPEDLNRIFDRYYIANPQAHPFSSGLGLSIAKDIVRMHKGSIEAISEEGQGTEFRITLPRWKKKSAQLDSLHESI